MTDIELEAKSDRELLIILVGKVNPVCQIVEKHDKTLYGDDNIPGLVFRVFALLLCVLILAADNDHVQKIIGMLFGR